MENRKSIRKIVILAIGSLGDVQPFIALGVGLQKAGYEVSVATHVLFEALVCKSGLGFLPVRSNPKEVFECMHAKADKKSNVIILRPLLSFSRAIKPFVQQTGYDLWAASQHADAILSSHLGLLFAPQISEILRVPYIRVYNLPTPPTRAFPSPFLRQTLGMRNGLFNYFTHFMVDTVMWLAFRSMINKWRKECLNLAPIPLSVNYLRDLNKRQGPVVIGVSSSVLPKPPDWGENIHLTGYWFLNNSHDWFPPDDLVAFLAAGPPPVYIGFGSMITGDTKKITYIILQSLARTKQRGLLSTGWGGLRQRDLPDNVFILESAPHDWLFPRMAAVVHHGGVGTTAAGLRAGIPSIIVPFFFDQPFWGKRVSDLGVGPKPIPISKLSVDRLAGAITRAISDDEMRRRAAELGERIRGEDGVARAVELIDRYLSSQ